MSKLRSRKLWAAIAAAITILGTAVTGQQEWSTAVWQLVVTVSTYALGQGIADANTPPAPPVPPVVGSTPDRDEVVF
jgi:hypothetical protein